MLASESVSESNNENLIGFIASSVETLRDDVAKIREQMATREDLARLEGRFTEKLTGLESRFTEKLARLEGRFTERLDVSTTSVRGDIEQVQLRLDSIDHGMSSRFEHLEGELSRLRSAVYLREKIGPRFCDCLGKPAPRRLLKKSSDRVGLTISPCDLCGPPCLCGENANKNTHHRGTENHREDLLTLLDSFSATC